MKIHGDRDSGNCLKVIWTAQHLGRPFTFVPVALMQGQTKSPEFLEKFPMAQIPAVEFADGRCLAQSNAIIRYLARGSDLLPDDPFEAAKVDEWLFWEQYSHEPYIAVCRFHVHYLKRPKEAREAWRVERGEAALDLMERHLVGREYFVGAHLTVADIALLAYTRVAHEGGFDIETRPAVRAWVARTEHELGLARAQR